MSQHKMVSSENDDQLSASGHKSVSSEAEAISVGTEAGEELVEDGLDIETHGGGCLEDVPGFDATHAFTEGFESHKSSIAENQDSSPSCLLEYEQLESVCGRDDRVRITATTRVPWRMICQLFITRNDGRGSICTGWFIGPRTVMTAGHCVYSHSAEGWARSIKVVPGMDGSSRPYGSLVGTSFRSVQGWTRDRSPDYDYGAIILPNNSLGNRVGWFGFAALSDGSLNELLINNSGYPGDKPTGTQWFNSGRITKVTDQRLFYMLDTAGGQSGSITWRLREGKRHAVGIHAYGGCPNKSTRINREVFDNMKMWKNLGS